jgi:hypothetical protein
LSLDVQMDLIYGYETDSAYMARTANSARVASQ